MVESNLEEIPYNKEIEYTKLSIFAYLGKDGDTDQLRSELDSENFELLHFFSIESSFDVDTQGFLAKNKETKEMVLAFRGSEVTTGDILSGLKFRRAPYPQDNSSSSVHKGFLEAWEASKAEIKTHVMANIEDAMSFAVTGHSLGGGLATIASYEFSIDPIINEKGPVTLYTIGSPRTGDKHFNNLLKLQKDENKLNYLRVVYDQDWAAHLPPFFANPFLIHHNPTKMYKRRIPIINTIRQLIYGEYYIKEEATIMKMKLGLIDYFPYSLVKIITDVFYTVTDLFRKHDSDHDKFGYLRNIITRNGSLNLDEEITDKVKSDYLIRRLRV